jgi:hypothetical protein
MIELKKRPIIIIGRLHAQPQHGRETQKKPLYCWLDEPLKLLLAGSLPAAVTDAQRTVRCWRTLSGWLRPTAQASPFQGPNNQVVADPCSL